MTDGPKRVLLTYGWCRTAYVTLKSLALKGIDVYVADHSPTAMCRFSRYTKKFIRIPDEIDNEEKYVAYISALIREYSIDVYMPVNIETFIAAKYIDRFPGGVKVCLAGYDTIRKLNNKKESAAIAVKLGIPMPKTASVTDIDELDAVKESLKFPVVIKCLEMQGSKGVVFVEKKQDLAVEYTRLIEKSAFSGEELPIIQEFVEGEKYGVSCLYTEGTPVAVFTHKRLLEKFARGGPSTRRVSVREPVLEEYAGRLLSGVKWHGLAMVEFIYDKKTEKAYFLEVNPRLWGSLGLPYVAGVDFPYLAYRTALGEVIEGQKHCKEGVRVNWILGDIMALFDHMLKGKRRIRFLRQFIDFRADGYDDLNRDDIMPLFGEFLDYFLRLLKTRSGNPVYKRFLNNA
jgi:predicted ATP-grasp superfamily ATP-dependent carboligase